MTADENYLKKELYSLVKSDSSIFDFLQEGSLDGLWYWDLEKPEHEWMSPRFWTLLGYDPNEKQHLASEWQDLIFPEDLEIAIDNFNKHCVDSSHPYDQVVRYKHKNGSTIWVRCRGLVIRNGKGKPVRMLGAHTDLTSQKKAEKNLKESEEKFRLLFEHSADAHVLYKGNEFIDCNQASITMLGFEDKEQLLNIHPADISPEQQPDGQFSKEKAKSMIGLAFEKDSHRFEWVCQRPDGSNLLLNVLLTVIRVGGEALIHGVWRDITKQKQVEESLRESERKFRALFEQSGGYCMILDPQTSDGIPVIVDVNEATYIKHGYTQEELIGRPVSDLNNEDNKRLVKNRTIDIMKGKPFSFESVHVRKDGTSFPVFVNTQRIDLENGRTFILTTEYDITERKKAEEALKQNEQRYKKAQRIGQIGSWEYNLMTRKVWGSEEAKRIYGFDPQKEFFTTEEVEQCILDRQRVHQALVNLIEKQQPYNLEFEIQPLGGLEKKYIKSFAEVVVNESGTPTKVDGVILDITDLKLVDEKLRESEEKYRQLFHSIKDSILIADANRNIIDCNQTFRECFGYSEKEIIGRQTACLYGSKKEFLKVGEKLKDCWELDEKSFSYNINYKKKSGEIFPGETNAFSLKNDKGETVGFVGITKDITRRKMVEESLQKAKEELERKAVELEDINTALKVLLQKRDRDNLELQENIYSNYDLMLTPFLSKLKNRLGNKNQQNLLDIIETNLQEIVAPFAKNLASPMMSLTSSEIQIATMIKQGYSNKEIATILNSSKRTIDTHRQNIRIKLKLNNEKINLKTYLMNL